MKSKKLNVCFFALVILFFVTTLVVGINKFVNKSRADEGVKLVVNFSEGDIPLKNSTSSEKSNILFDNFSVEIYSTLNNRWLLPNYSFSEMLSNNGVNLNLSKDNIVDCETFYFDDDVTSESWAYSFTGWHIVGTDSYIPMNTVFQQGNYLDLDNIDASLFGQTDGELTLNLEATWGRVYFIENKYKNMVYSEDGDTGYYYLDDANSTGLTGASDENVGNSLNSKLATIDEVYERLRNDDTLDEIDPYHTVIMFTGDVDYYKNNGSSKESGIFGFSGKYGSSSYIGSNKIRSASFKSYQKNKGDKYTLNIKPKGYYNFWYGSYRFDNINYKLMKNGVFGNQTISGEFLLASRSMSLENNFCFETTNRFDGAINTFRVLQTRTVVLSGGTYNTFSFGWSGEDKYGWERNWYVTDNVKINSSIVAGYECPSATIAQTAYGNVNISIYGGNVRMIEGGNRGAYTINVGNRNIKIKGNNSGDSQYDPIVTNVYGGSSQSRLFGNISLMIENCTNITNVYGGGKDFTSNVYGNVSLKINKSTILGNVYGGGYNGNTLKVPDTYKEYSYSNSVLSSVERDVSNLNSKNFSIVKGDGGDVSLNFSKSTIKGNIYGSGFGTSQVTSFSYLSSISYNQSSDNWITGVGAGTVYPSGWDNSYKEYPKYDPETGYILIAVYRNINYTNLTPSSIGFNEWSASAYLSLATVENVHIKLDNSVVGSSNKLSDKSSGNVYGGGSISKVLGNTEIEIINNSIVYGNVYGGGDGSTKPDPVTVYKPIDDDVYEMPTYEILSVFNNNGTLSANVKTTAQKPSYNSSTYGKFTWSGDASLLNSDTQGIDFENKLLYSENTKGLGSVMGDTSVVVSNKSLISGSVYGGGNAGVVEGNTGVYIYSSNINGMVYAGGDSADVLKDTKLVIDDDSSVNKNVFGGGNSGNISGNSNIDVSNSSLSSVFGGGYSGIVSGNTTIKVNSGKLENVFGGGDQSYVSGDTNVTIGNEDSSDTVTISGLVYGGGRGYDADDDGDASDFTTVKGSSNVLIQGINTNVSNYGSTKLGSVALNVDVRFKNYWSGNSTAKYKTMNGIDRATTVSFDNSYVLLENKGADGKLVGIKSIENLVIPEGSGLKISANGEITGDFNGGGELYLDSLVSLTVKGNITGKTTLILNPKLLENGNKTIKGGLDFPYLKIGGTAPDDIAIVSGEEAKYVIREASRDVVNDLKGEDYIYFYISGDVSVDNSIDITSDSDYDRVYINNISNDKTVYMLNNGLFTTDIDALYYLTNDDYNTYDYTNINRKLELISNSDNSIANIPLGTEITMKINDNYYFYRVSDDTKKINLSDFKDELGRSYAEVKNFDTSSEVVRTINEINGTTSYSLDEKYKFIFNFNNSEGILEDSYYPSLEVFYGGNSFENVKKDVAKNVVEVQKRGYDLNLDKDKSSYDANGVIKLNGKINISSVNANTNLLSDSLVLKLKLKDSNDNFVSIPDGSYLSVGDMDYFGSNGAITFKLLNNLNSSNILKDVDIKLNMSKVLPQDRLSAGDYNIVVYASFSDNYQELARTAINILNMKANFGLMAQINSIDSILEDKLNLIEYGQDTDRSIKISFLNDISLNNMNIRISAVERTGMFVYDKTDNADQNIIIKKSNISSSASKLEDDVFITFKQSLDRGTYRIVVSLYDDAGNYKTSDYVNFIVN